MRLNPDEFTTFITSPTEASVETATISIRGDIISRAVWRDIARMPRIMRRSSVSAPTPSLVGASRTASSSAAGSSGSSVRRPARRSSPRAGVLINQANGASRDARKAITRARR